MESGYSHSSFFVIIFETSVANHNFSVIIHSVKGSGIHNQIHFSIYDCAIMHPPFVYITQQGLCKNIGNIFVTALCIAYSALIKLKLQNTYYMS